MYFKGFYATLNLSSLYLGKEDLWLKKEESGIGKVQICPRLQDPGVEKTNRTTWEWYQGNERPDSRGVCSLCCDSSIYLLMIIMYTALSQCKLLFDVCLVTCLARSANLPEGLYILPIFFFIKKNFFLMVDFLAPIAQMLIEQSSPKFQHWQKGVRACSSHWAFLIFQGTLPWQPMKVKKSAFFSDQSTLSLCYSETEWNNALYMQNIIASRMPL